MTPLQSCLALPRLASPCLAFLVSSTPDTPSRRGHCGKRTKNTRAKKEYIGAILIERAWFGEANLEVVMIMAVQDNNSWSLNAWLEGTFVGGGRDLRDVMFGLSREIES
ncbi:hypothetical protein E2C01_024660 [Portunus trituberculatus]|uniref:Uncharacterized protein n=1 Tax=Portunus trituberculatus TaxID=210409 RepID=A0A5B7EEC6_PORTR|nr:hypothetical protein [Portunus trituberculatus]